MLAVLVGEGANEVEITALVFSSMEEGLKKCKELFGEKRMKKHGNEYRWYWGEIPDEIAKKTYKDYYDGCGGCGAFTLKEVEEGKPFAVWNLD